MPVITEESIRTETLFNVAKKMMVAARTAPKLRGEDNLTIGIVESEVIEQIAVKMREIGEQIGSNSFLRDSENVLNATIMILIGTKIKSMGLKKCSVCGFANCEEKDKNPDVPCAFNTNDLGIAIGSAVSVAMDNRVDNRIMHTVGYAVMELGLLGKDVKIVYGIPLSATAKNPFFDRKPELTMTDKNKL